MRDHVYETRRSNSATEPQQGLKPGILLRLLVSYMSLAHLSKLAKKSRWGASHEALPSRALPRQSKPARRRPPVAKAFVDRPSGAAIGHAVDGDPAGRAARRPNRAAAGRWRRAPPPADEARGAEGDTRARPELSRGAAPSS